MRYSIRKQFACIFIGLMAGTILLCWFINNTFLEKYYFHNKQTVVMDAYKQMNAAAQKGSISSDDFDIHLQQLSARYNISILVLDEDSVTLKKGDQVITITPTEYKMLSLFMKSPGKVFTKMQIYQAVNGECYVNDDNTLMVHISNLRDKIEDNPREPRYIKNIRGIGYKIEKL